MRTRIGASSGHGSPAIARWAATTAATAASGSAKAAKKASPSVLTTAPPARPIASLSRPSCRATRPAQRAEPTARSSRVEPSMSVNTNVTDGPVGSPIREHLGTAGRAATGSVDGRLRLRPLPLGGDRGPNRLDVDDAVPREAGQQRGSVRLLPLELARRPPQSHPDLREHAPGEVLQLAAR